jgi:hypothetical protein
VQREEEVRCRGSGGDWASRSDAVAVNTVTVNSINDKKRKNTKEEEKQKSRRGEERRASLLYERSKSGGTCMNRCCDILSCQAVASPTLPPLIAVKHMRCSLAKVGTLLYAHLGLPLLWVRYLQQQKIHICSHSIASLSNLIIEGSCSND